MVLGLCNFFIFGKNQTLSKAGESCSSLSVVIYNTYSVTSKWYGELFENQGNFGLHFNQTVSLSWNNVVVVFTQW